MKYLIFFFICLLVCLKSYSQTVDSLSNIIENDNIMDKFIEIDFQDNFRKDSCILFVNRVLIFNGILYSDISDGFADSKKIYYSAIQDYDVDFEITFCYFEKKYKQIGKYNPVVVYKYLFNPKKHGNFVGIGIQMKQDFDNPAYFDKIKGWQNCDWVPVFETQFEPFEYD